MNKFKVGDYVKCIDASMTMELIKGAGYWVEEVDWRGDLLLRDIGKPKHMCTWHPSRFVLVEEPPKPVPHATSVPHVHAALIKAWADGAKIECRYHPKGEWFDTESPSWNLTNEYRIKPEPKPDVTLAMCIGQMSTGRAVVYDHGRHNIKATFDGETGKLKSVEMI